MSLIDEIRIAQRNAGEDAVIRNLERQGLGSIATYASGEETSAAQSAQHSDEFLCPLCYDDPDNIKQQTQPQHPDDPCPGCRKGGVCRTPKCGRLKLPVDHPYRTEKPAQQECPCKDKCLHIGMHQCKGLPSPLAEQPVQHPDDQAVDRFARRMKWKLEQARQRGRSGWEDRAWTPEQISQALREHVEKGDPIDVANYCLFLTERNEGIQQAKPSEPLTDDQKDAARYRWLKARLMGADFDWNESGACALVFEWPKDMPVGADCDQNIDTAIEAANGAKGST